MATSPLAMTVTLAPSASPPPASATTPPKAGSGATPLSSREKRNRMGRRKQHCPQKTGPGGEGERDTLVPTKLLGQLFPDATSGSTRL